MIPAYPRSLSRPRKFTFMSPAEGVEKAYKRKMDQAGNPLSRLPRAVAEALARGALILTPNQRLARNLRRAFDQEMQLQSRLDWIPPDIFAVDSWLSEAWQRLTRSGFTSRVLLNRTQELSLWLKILSADPKISALRSLDVLAEMAASAWSQLCAYNGRSRAKDAGDSTDTRAFRSWCTDFEQSLQRSGYITSAELPAALRSSAPASELLAENKGILLVDFDIIPPALKDLLSALQHSGRSVDEYKSSTPTASAHIHEAATERKELERAAVWTSQVLTQNPASRVAIVIPNLAFRRPEIVRIFGQTLAPELERFRPSENSSLPAGPLEFSLGSSLHDAPLIKTGLDLLRWTTEPLPIAVISELLLSPFFGGVSPAADPFAIAEFDALELRRHSILRPELSLPAAIRLVELSSRRLRLASLLAQLKSLQHTAQREIPDPHRQRAHAEWSDLFAVLLQAAGWTRSAHTDSFAFQIHRRFDAALEELGTLDFDGTRADARAALESLQRIVHRAIFAPESHDAPVQIMGPLEVGGAPLDALWFLGAGDLGWPRAPISSPLLPGDLKRTLGLPGSNAERDNAAALVLTQRIAASAREVVFSFATKVEDALQRPSPILSELNLQPLAAPAPPLDSETGAMETFSDSTAIPPLPDRITRGGAQLLQAQAACGFRAFAEHRLVSTELELRTPGLDDLERGSLVHRVMEHFWSKVTTQAELAATPPIERDFLLEECITFAIERTRASSEGTWDDAYLSAQRKRLLNLLRPWLEQELNRPPFTVRSQEKRLNDVRLGPLRLDLRVDRIDDTEAGTVILDYKTGRAHPNDWKSERPDAPQLPLYAILSGEPVKGIAFALLRAGKDLALKGFADSANLFGPITRGGLSMQDQIETWNRDLTALAVAFDHGDPRPDPKIYPTTCSRCSQRLVCRLDPATLRPFDEDDELAEEEYAFG